MEMIIRLEPTNKQAVKEFSTELDAIFKRENLNV